MFSACSENCARLGKLGSTGGAELLPRDSAAVVLHSEAGIRPQQ